jgi:hypothetical protein
MKPIFKGRRYSIKSEYNGAFYLLTRLADGATVFMQGDDADEIRCQIECVSERFTADDLCAQYDDVMSAQS